MIEAHLLGRPPTAADKQKKEEEKDEVEKEVEEGEEQDEEEEQDQEVGGQWPRWAT